MSDTMQQIQDDQNRIRKEALTRRVLYVLRDTVELRGYKLETRTDDIRVEFTDASARIIAQLVEAVDILEAIILASDGCQGHKHCIHSMEPWQRARALLQGKWDAYKYRRDWP